MKRKIALLSDIHGNLTALDAVLEDAINEQVTEYWLLGDIVMQGPASSEIFKRIEPLQPSVWLKGNWDELLLCTADKTAIDLDNPTDIYTARLGMNLLERTTQEQLETLRQLPVHITQTINGVTISLSHHLTDKNWGRELVPTNPQENFDRLFLTNDVDVAIYGHTHVQLMRYGSAGQLIINPGSIGNPFYQRKKMRKAARANYAVLEIDDQGMTEVFFKQIPYDVEKEIERAHACNFPYVELYIEQIKRGITRTHDWSYLDQINDRCGYKFEVDAYLREK